MKTPERILAIKLRSLGDTVLMTAPLLELHEAFPRSAIDVAVPAAWAPLLENHPAVRKVWTFERRDQAASRARAVTRLALAVRREAYDWAVNFHASPSSSLIAFASGAAVRSVHFHGHRDRNRYSTVEVPGKGTLKPVIERDMDTVRALGLSIPAGRLPRVFLREQEGQAAQGRLDTLSLTGPVLGIGLGASRPTKHWPAERFAQLAVRWCLDREGSALAVTSPQEEPLARDFLKQVDDALTELVPDTRLRALIRPRIRVESTLGIRELSAVISRLSAFAGNDSGPRHLAVAVGTPSVTLFGPEDPTEWHPYPQDLHPRLFLEGLPCRRDADPGMPAWCGLQECSVEKLRCMTGIGVQEVLTRVLQVARKPL